MDLQNCRDAISLSTARADGISASCLFAVATFQPGTRFLLSCHPQILPRRCSTCSIKTPYCHWRHLPQTDQCKLSRFIWIWFCLFHVLINFKTVHRIWNLDVLLRLKPWPHPSRCLWRQLCFIVLWTVLCHWPCRFKSCQCTCLSKKRVFHHCWGVFLSWPRQVVPRSK